VSLLFVSTLLAAETPQQQVAAPERKVISQAATVEVVFVIDTTGSMSGLIQGAKDTIWTVVNDFAMQEPQPEIRVGLVAYRDRGDEYITRSLPLTGDLDHVYGWLYDLNADGGGDTPESVGRALYSAVNDMSWTGKGQGPVYRSVFVVGDAPNKAYADELSPRKIVGLARDRGIYVNAIQCGNAGATTTEFAAIASLGSGAFQQVAQSGGVATLVSPMDDELARLERELASTVVAYGGEADEVVEKLEKSASSSASVKAARLSTLSKLGGVAVTGDGDLVTDWKEGKIDLEDEEAMPEELASLSVAERKRTLEKNAEDRGELQAQIDELVAARDAWVEEQREAAPSAAPSYDREVVDSSIEALRSLGYVY